MPRRRPPSSGSCSEVSGSLVAATLSGLWLALLPLHVWESHFAVTDVVMTFWTVVALALSVRLLRRGGWRDYALTGAAIGLAVASKYTAALVVVSPLVASLLAARPVSSSLSGLVALGVTALALCFLGTPFSFLHFSQFRRRWPSSTSTCIACTTASAFPLSAGSITSTSTSSLPVSRSASASRSMRVQLPARCGTASHPRREHVVVLAFAVPFFAILGHWTFMPLRYMLPVVVVGGRAGGHVARGVAGERLTHAAGLGSGRRCWCALYTAVFIVPTTARLRHDTRIEAAHWLDQTLKPGQRLLLCGYSPYVAMPTDPRIVVNAVNEVWICQLVDRGDVDLVEITSMLYWRHERHRHPAFDPEYHRFRAGERGFHLVKRFDADFLNRDLYRRLDPMFAGYFISPELEFYARDGGGA